MTTALVLAVALGLLAGGAYALAGLALALLVVAGLLLTAGVIPGFWWFATSTVGYPIVIVLAGVAAHALFGAETLVGIFAIGWTLAIKTAVLAAARARVRAGHSAGPTAHEQRPATDSDLVQAERAGRIYVVPLSP